MIRRTVRKAFTLVEILIVVVILGILAAIVVPQFTNATQDAQAGNLKAQLSSLNRQIELFRARNNGLLPGGAEAGEVDTAEFWNILINGDGADVKGGYIKAPPVNPAFLGGGANASAIATATDDTGSADAGWTITTEASGTLAGGDYIPAYTLFASYFNETTGEITPDAP